MKHEKRKEIARKKKMFFIGSIIGIVIGTLIFIYNHNVITSLIALVISPILILVYDYFRKSLKESAKIKKVESVFPDFLQLMASNLKAGMTIDKAMLSSSRPEFDPLDKEILEAGREITTGKSVETAILNMSKRLKSDKIHKVILLIISGIRAGGDLAVLLEDTASNIREREFVEKRAASNVLMYVIFIFLVVSIFAPALFALSTILVEVLTNILAGLPSFGVSMSTSNLPFSLSEISISLSFIVWFSVIFIIVIDVLAALILGLVSKGEEKQGMRYLPAILLLSLGTFSIARIIISNIMSKFL